MKDFTLYYLFKMQPNALLIRQNFIVVKSRCYKSIAKYEHTLVRFMIQELMLLAM
jgi:hypothetical protein